MASTVMDVGQIGPGEEWLVEHIRHNVHVMKLNRVITAVGPPGAGKSWTGLEVGTRVDPGFGIDRVVFPGLDYIRAVADPGLDIGSFVEWDDAGLGAPSREFWTMLNRAVGMVAQSSRFRRLVIWVTLPDKSFLDSQPRKLVDIHLEFMRRTKPDQPIEARVYMVETDAKRGNIFYKHPRIDSPEGPLVIETIKFLRPPPVDLSDAYERKKAAYMMAFYKGMIEDIETGGIALDDYTARMVLLVADYGSQLGKTQAQVAKALGIRSDSFSRALRKARQKTGLP